jgi:predicted transcriptional regulator
MTSTAAGTAWTLLTGHGHVLVAIAKNPRARIRDLALDAGLTERTTQAIIADLEAAGYITRHRTGRRTEYTVNTERGFRHPNQEGLQIGPFLRLLTSQVDIDEQEPDVNHDFDPTT